ncbi:hypothetical protein F4808DRAFT_42005 [Astrocystis sublimbata]|nr:hypothetical protein F4808DRAFT_42005 [Astrocystis sublimbata]
MPLIVGIAQPSAGQLQEHTYRKSRIVDFTLDDADLETRCPLDNARHAFQPLHGVSQLDKLPLEIITEILIALDLPTLIAFRRVNYHAMSLVDSVYQFRMIRKHCPNVLRAILSINARFLDCRTLYETLLTTKCATCRHFGNYLYVLTCKRVCYSCFTSNLNYFPVSSRHAAKHTGLKIKDLKRRLPHVSSLPGRYTSFGRLARSRTLLFDRQSMVEGIWHGSVLGPGETIQQQDRMTTEPRRYMSIISAPYLASSGQSADWGYFCTRCKESTDPATFFRIKFTKDGILNHLKQHGVTTLIFTEPSVSDKSPPLSDDT